MSSLIGKNLMEPEPTLLPEEPEVKARYDAGDLPEEIAQRFPASSLAWAMASEDAWDDGRTLNPMLMLALATTAPRCTARCRLEGCWSRPMVA